MNKNVLVVSSSLRSHSNSERLADEFVRGVQAVSYTHLLLPEYNPTARNFKNVGSVSSATVIMRKNSVLKNSVDGMQSNALEDFKIFSSIRFLALNSRMDIGIKRRFPSAGRRMES